MKNNMGDKVQLPDFPAVEAHGEVDKIAEAAVASAMTEERPVDYRYVRHGHGPCDCCGPHSE